MELISCSKNVKVFCKVLSKCMLSAVYRASILSPAASEAEEDVKLLLINFTLVCLRSITSGDRETGWEAFAVKQVRSEKDLAEDSDRAGRIRETYTLFRKKN